METFEYVTKGTCARKIVITLDGNKVENVHFVGGCMGNTQGVAALCKGLTAEEVIAKLKGIQCGYKGTSCPDQLATALEQHFN